MFIEFDSSLPKRPYKVNDFHFHLLPSIELEKFMEYYYLNIRCLFFAVYFSFVKED